MLINIGIRFECFLLIFRLTGQISKLEQLDMQARCYLNIGVVKEHMEDFEESIANIEKAIKISKCNDIFELTHTCYVSMSLLFHCKKNDPTSALRYCNFALDVAKRLPQKVKKICETLITKSEILIKAGDFSSAKQMLTKAYKKNTSDENDRNTIEKTLRVGKLHYFLQENLVLEQRHVFLFEIASLPGSIVCDLSFSRIIAYAFLLIYIFGINALFEIILFFLG